MFQKILYISNVGVIILDHPQVTSHFKTNPMKRILITLILSLSLINCKKNNSVQRENEPAIYKVEEVDAEMNTEIEKAKQTLPQFYKALESKNRNYDGFGIKMTFPYDKGNEHIWVNSLFKKKNEYFGIIDNLPEFTSEVKQGDTVKIESDRISDWMYLKNSELEGGYTIKLLRLRMTIKERANFDKVSGMIIK